MVKAWNEPCNYNNVLDRWQFMVRTFRRIVKGWAPNEVAKLDKRKVELAEEYNRLDDEARNGGLSTNKLARLKVVANELGKI